MDAELVLRPHTCSITEHHCPTRVKGDVRRAYAIGRSQFFAGRARVDNLELEPGEAEQY